jgi:D-3-phosphoglycerate dehydrogenase
MHTAGKRLLEAKADLIFARSLDEESLVEQARDVDAIIIRANGRVSARIMDAAAPRLRVVGRHGVGLDGIDLAAAKARGIPVVYTPEANTESVAEQCIGLMLSAAKQINRADAALRRGEWNVRYEYIGQQLWTKTLGLVGFGRIGQRVAEIGHAAFAMPIVYYDVVSYQAAERKLDARRVSLDDLFSISDHISAHLPLFPETVGVIDRHLFERMKPTAFFYNTARGGVVDEPALLWALTTHRIAGAGFDVYAKEPLPADDPLLKLENVVVTPHMAAHTDEALAAMSMVARDVLNVLEGRAPVYRAA